MMFQKRDQGMTVRLLPADVANPGGLFREGVPSVKKAPYYYYSKFLHILTQMQSFSHSSEMLDMPKNYETGRNN